MRIFSPKVIFIILLGIFLLPLFSAVFLYQYAQQHHLATTNYGKLLYPPLSLTSILSMPVNRYEGHWLFLYVTPFCDTLCSQNLYKMRQLRLAAGKDQDRLFRLLITSAKFTLPQEYEGTYQENIALFIPAGLYLADPHGNIIFYYKKNADAQKVLKDLTRLLRISQIG